MKQNNWGVLLVGIAVAVSSFCVVPSAFAAAIQGSGTSTYIAVFSGSNTITSFPTFVFDNSTGIFAVNAVSSLQAVTFTNATGTSLNLSGNLSVGGSITAGSPVGVGSGGTGTSSFPYGVVAASSTSPFSTIAPGTSGNVLISNGSVWTSAAPSSASNLVSSFVSGESVNQGDAVYVSDGLIPSVTQELYNASLYSDASLTSYYRLEGNPNDSKGANNGTTQGASYSTSYGYFGQGISCDNTPNYVSLPNGVFNWGTSNWTVSFWFKMSNTNQSGGQNFIASYTSGVAPGFVAYYDTSAGNLRFDYASGKTISYAWVGADTNWHLYTVTADPTNGHTLYLDGVNVASNADTTVTPNSSGAVGLGTFLAGGSPRAGYTYAGDLDDVAFFSRSLSAGEVGSLYNGTANGRNAGQIYRASATNHVFSDGFLGFAATNISSGSSGNVIVSGLANVFTSLSPGKQYYVDNSTGTISTTPGSVTRKVGIAISTTTLLITNTW